MIAEALLDLMKAASIAVDSYSAEFMAEMAKVFSDMGVTDQDVLDATSSDLQTLVTNLLRATNRAASFATVSGTDLEPDGYAYLGDTMATTRPFCLECVDTWFLPDELDDLDNGMGLPVRFFCGGYNCEHDWYPLYGDQTSEYAPGDVAAANEAAS